MKDIRTAWGRRVEKIRQGRRVRWCADICFDSSAALQTCSFANPRCRIQYHCYCICSELLSPYYGLQ